MATPEYDVVIERAADGAYEASISELPLLHLRAHDLDELLAALRAAIKDAGGQAPELLLPPGPPGTPDA